DTGTASFEAPVKRIDRSCANFKEDFVVFRNRSVNVDDFEDFTGLRFGVDGGFHWATTRRAGSLSFLGSIRDPMLRRYFVASYYQSCDRPNVRGLVLLGWSLSRYTSGRV